MYTRNKIFPLYKANRRGGPVVRKRAPQIERRALAADIPEIEFLFTLPEELAFAVAPGPVAGIVGITVSLANTVAVRGRFTKDQILGKAAEFLRAIAPPGYLARHPIAGKLTRFAHPGPTESGPLVPKKDEDLTIEVVSGDPVVVIAKSSLRPLIVGGPRKTRR